MSACSSKYVAIKHKLPNKPDIRKIKVKDGCVCGEDLDNLIKNWTDLHDYIDQLENAGCFEKVNASAGNEATTHSYSWYVRDWDSRLSHDEKEMIIKETKEWLKRKSPCQKARVLKWDANK